MKKQRPTTWQAEIEWEYRHWADTHTPTWETDNLVGNMLGWPRDFVPLSKPDVSQEEDGCEEHEHYCTSDCRRNGCNCYCGHEWHSDCKPLKEKEDYCWKDLRTGEEHCGKNCTFGQPPSPIKGECLCYGAAEHGKPCPVHSPQPQSDWESKICGNCKVEKPLSEFHRKLDKWQSFCKVCYRKYDNVRYQKHKKKRLAKDALRMKQPHVLLKNQARARLRHEVKMGRIIKPEVCDEAKFKGATPCRGKIEAHHFRGYTGDHAFDVLWLCKEHHMEAHYG